MVLSSSFSRYRVLRNAGWETDPEGRVVVYRPRFGSGQLGVRISRLLGFELERVRLDEMGSFVWRFGHEKTAAEIVEAMRSEFGGKIEPAEERLREFLMNMRRARLIKIGEDPKNAVKMQRS